jgi:prepilin-type N-terminal cleavage/methylation domain-containing protein
MNHHKKGKHAGFSLVEMAIVIVIFGLLLSALLIPLQAQRNVAFQHQTEATLESARQALLGFAQTNGRLPCPATDNGGAFPDGTGTSNPNASGACAQQVGFLPAKTLGILPTDDQGFALDAWNNRIRYAVTQNSTAKVPNPATPDFTTVVADDPTTPLINEADGMNAIGVENLTPDLMVCATSTPAGCNANINLVDNAVAVIFSVGATGLNAGGVDEAQNLTSSPNTVFVSHTSTSASAANGEFDHLVIWLSPYVLYNAMIQAGQLH